MRKKSELNEAIAYLSLCIAWDVFRPIDLLGALLSHANKLAEKHGLEDRLKAMIPLLGVFYDDKEAAEVRGNGDNGD